MKIYKGLLFPILKMKTSQHLRKLGEIATEEFRNREQYKYRDFSGIPGYNTAINLVLLAEGVGKALKYDAIETAKRHPKIANTVSSACFNLFNKYLDMRVGESYFEALPATGGHSARVNFGDENSDVALIREFDGWKQYN